MAENSPSQLTEGFPQQPNPTFKSPKPFPIENRGGLALQDMSAVKKHIESSTNALEALSDFHFLAYLKSTGVFQPVFNCLFRGGRLTFVQEDWKALSEAVQLTDAKEVERSLMNNASWQTLLTIAKESVTGRLLAGCAGGGREWGVDIFL